MIIALEGMDASGKNTHAKLLAKKLDGVVISFPDYSTPTGKVIREHLQRKWHCCDIGDNRSNEFDSMVFQTLMTTNRLELRPAIKAHLVAGRHIVFDRYYASALVYGGLDGLDPAWIQLIQATLPEPDAWVFLDIPPEESVRRRPERRDRYEKQPGLMEKVRVSYLRLFDEKQRAYRVTPGHPPWHVVTAMGEVDEVHQRILTALRQAPALTV